MKEELDRELPTVEPFVESVPQVFVLLGIWFATELPIIPLYNPDDGFGWLLFVTSVLSATFGITNFLKVGPMRVVPADKYCGGFCHLSFPLVFTTVLTSLLAKGFTMGIYMMGGPESKDWYIPVSLVSLFLPNLLFALTLMVRKLGPKTALKTMARYLGSISSKCLSTFPQKI